MGCDELVGLQLNEGLQVIGYLAFEGCTPLRSVTIPSTVTEWGGCAFRDCSNLAEVRLNEGLQVIGANAFEGCTSLRSVTTPSTVTEVAGGAFFRCSNLVELQLNEGLRIIGDCAFERCTALRSVNIPSTVTELGDWAFRGCSNLAEVQLNEGLEFIGEQAFEDCTSLRSISIPSTVTELGDGAFYFGCSNLSEVILLGGQWLLNLEFFARGSFSEEKGILNQGAIDKILFDEGANFAFHGCPVTEVKISISWAVSERMARLPLNCRSSVEERIHSLHRLELLQEGNVLACFPVVSRAPDDEAEDDSDDEAEDGTFEVLDTNHETARSLHQLLQLIAFHELKEASVVIELAIWKSRIDGAAFAPRADCRVAIPDPAKSLIMEYCGFAGFLKSAIEGA